jgi:hypothetical protein
MNVPNDARKYTYMRIINAKAHLTAAARPTDALARGGHGAGGVELVVANGAVVRSLNRLS